MRSGDGSNIPSIAASTTSGTNDTSTISASTSHFVGTPARSAPSQCIARYTGPPCNSEKVSEIIGASRRVRVHDLPVARHVDQHPAALRCCVEPASELAHHRGAVVGELSRAVGVV